MTALQKEEFKRIYAQMYEEKGRADMTKVTLEQKKQAVKIALEGGNPLEWLKECGSKNPDSLWYLIRKNLQEVDPKAWEKLQNVEVKKGRKKWTATCCQPAPESGVSVPDELPEELPEEEKKEVDYMELAESTLQKEEAAETEPETDPKPLTYDGFTVHGIECEYGKFDYDRKHDLLDWTTPDGEEVCWSPECWKTIATEILPKAMAILGIPMKN